MCGVGRDLTLEDWTGGAGGFLGPTTVAVVWPQDSGSWVSHDFAHWAPSCVIICNSLSEAPKFS